MDRRVAIQAGTEARAVGSGQVTTSWATVKTVWCRFRPASPGREPFTNGQVAAFADSEFEIRYDRGIPLSPKKHRLLFEGRVYNILGVTEPKRRELVRILGQARAE